MILVSLNFIFGFLKKNHLWIFEKKWLGSGKAETVFQKYSIRHTMHLRQILSQGLMQGMSMEPTDCTSSPYGLFTLPNSDIDSHSDCKQNCYVELCTPIHNAQSWIQIPILTVNYMNGIGIGLRIGITAKSLM